MKRILSILGTITLIATSTTSLIACDNITKYTQEQLKELKEKNSKIINGNKLEWIAPQEKHFDKVDNKYYFVVWRGNKKDNWKITKFKNDNFSTYEQLKNVDIEFKNNYKLYLYRAPYFSVDLIINKINNPVAITQWRTDKDKNYFKAVYRFNDKGEPDTLIIDPKTGEVINWKEDKEVKKDK